MVERIYGQLSPSTYEKAIDRLPFCTLGVREVMFKDRLYKTHETKVAMGAETRNARTLVKQSVSGVNKVPRDRIELPTRGFSVLCSTD